MIDDKIKSPFKFLDPFGQEDSEFFFGRDKEVKLLYDYVNKNRIVLVYGQSGTGKTSIVQCGLANSFESTEWLPFFIRRNSNINDSLIDALSTNIIIGNDDIELCKQEVFQDEISIENKNLNRVHNSENIISEKNKNHIARVFCHIKKNSKKFLRPIYLILDQFEELLILGSDEEKNLFIETLMQLVGPKAPVSCHIIIIMREEYFAWLDQFEKRIPDIADRRLRVEMMFNRDVKTVIKSSCEKFNIELEDPERNSEQIVSTLSQKGFVSLPYLQVYLDQLWRVDYKRTYPERITKKNGTLPLTFTTNEIAEFGEIEDVLLRYVHECIDDIQSNLKENFSDLDGKFLYDVFDILITEDGTKRPIPYTIINKTYNFKDKTKQIENLSYEALIYTFHQLEKYRILRNDSNVFELAHDSMGAVIQKIKSGKVLRPKLRTPEIEGNPYKGLMSYDPEDYKKFFGRERVVLQLLKKFEKNSLITVVGPSGAGKSSLVKAGVIPVLEKRGYSVLSIKPEDAILFESDEKISKSHISIDELKQNLNNNNKSVLFIDQFEQLSTRCDDPDQLKQFIEFVNHLISNNVKVILTVRSDYELEFDQSFAKWKEGKFNVPPFLDYEIREVITEPAYYAGLEFYPEYLVDVITREVQQSNGTLPLLSYTLSEMYETYKLNDLNDGTLTEDYFNKVGGVIGGLQKRASEIYDDYNENDPHRRTIRNLMFRMIAGIGERAGKRVLKSRLKFNTEEEDVRIENVLNKFIDRRLVITGKTSEGETYYEPAHDSLVRNWRMINDWISSDTGKDHLHYQNVLIDPVKDYKSFEKLWNDDPRLDTLKKIVDSEDNWLNKIETEFINSSIKKKKELEQEKKKAEQEKKSIEEENLKLSQEAEKYFYDAKKYFYDAKKYLKQRSNLTLIVLLVVVVSSLSLLFLSYSSSKKYKNKNDAYKKAVDSLIIAKTIADNAIDTAKTLVSQIQELNRTQTTYIEFLTQSYALVRESNKKYERTEKANNKLLIEKEKTITAYELQKQPFYLSIALDSTYKEALIRKLVSLKFDKKKLDNFEKFKSALNKITEAIEEAKKMNTNYALVLAKQAHNIDPTNSVIDSMALDIANSYMFTEQKIENAGQNENLVISAISNDRSRFAFTTKTGIKTGFIKNEKIYINPNELNYIEDSTSPKSIKINSFIDRTMLLSSLQFTNNNDLIAITKDFKVHIWDKDFNKKIISLKDKGEISFNVSAVSPDGKTMGRDFKGLFFKVFDIKTKKELLPDRSYDSIYGRISNIIYSPDSKKLLVNNDNLKYWSVDLENQQVKQIEDTSVPRIYGANFTAENNIIYASRDSINICDLNGKKITKGLYIGSSYLSDKLIISSDQKKLIYGDRFFYNNNEDRTRDTLFYPINAIANGFPKFTRFLKDESSVIGFSEENSILTILKLNKRDTIALNLISPHREFNKFSAAYNSINPEQGLTKQEQVKLGLISSEELSESEVYSKAKSYYDQTFESNQSPSATLLNLRTARVLYDSLMVLNPENENYIKTAKIIDANIFAIDSNYSTYFDAQLKTIVIEERFLQTYSDTLTNKHKYYKQSIAKGYGNLAYFSIFISMPDFNDAIKYANIGLAFNTPNNDWIYTNLALGYLMTGNFSKAKEIYKTYNGKDCVALNKSFNQAFQEDLTELRRKNIISDNKPAIKVEANRIERWLKKEINSLE